MNPQQLKYLDELLEQEIHEQQLDVNDKTRDTLVTEAVDTFHNFQEFESYSGDWKTALAEAAKEIVGDYLDRSNDNPIFDLQSDVANRRLNGQTSQSIAIDLDLSVEQVIQHFREGYIETNLACNDFRIACNRFQPYENVLFFIHADGTPPLAIIENYPDEVLHLLNKYDADARATLEVGKVLRGAQHDWLGLRTQGKTVEDIFKGDDKIFNNKGFPVSLVSHILTNRLSSMSQSLRNQLGTLYKNWERSKKEDAKQRREKAKLAKKEDTTRLKKLKKQ